MNKRFLRLSVLLVVLSVLMLPLSGCQFFQKPKPPEDAEDAGDSDSAGDEAAKPAAKAPPDLSPHPDVANYRPITVKTKDGITLVGTLYVPNISPYKPAPPPAPSEDGSGGDADASGDSDSGDAKPKPKEVKAIPLAAVNYPLVILCHMLSDDRWEWNALPKQLMKSGYAVLAFDMRGHGESIYRGKRLIVWRQFSDADWQKMPEDITPFLQTIQTQPELNMVNTKKVALIGASLGANVALNFAAAHADIVKALVILSPGLEYHGIQTKDAATKYPNALYAIASQEDSYAADSTQQLYKNALGKKKIQIYQDLGHGTDMLENNHELAAQIITWLQKALPSGVSPATEPTEKTKSEAGKTTSTEKAPTASSGSHKVPTEHSAVASPTHHIVSLGKAKPISPSVVSITRTKIVPQKTHSIRQKVNFVIPDSARTHIPSTTSRINKSVKTVQPLKKRSRIVAPKAPVAPVAPPPPPPEPAD